MRFSTLDVPEPERLSYWREAFARQIAGVEVDARSDAPFASEATLLGRPGLRAMWATTRTPAGLKRTADLVKDGDDDFVLIMPLEEGAQRSQRGADLDVARGEAVGILHAEPATLQFRAISYVALMVPRLALVPRVADVEAAATHVVPSSSEALRLLRLYLTMLRDNPETGDVRLCDAVAAHVYDLLGLALGATRDAEHVAMARGMRTARMKAIKSDFAANPALSLRALAARQRISPRSVQMLFEAGGTNFTAYALEVRLERVRAMLTDGRYAAWTVSAIALHAGFGDLSHFNRSFRRRFGVSPHRRAGSSAVALR